MRSPRVTVLHSTQRTHNATWWGVRVSLFALLFFIALGGTAHAQATGTVSPYAAWPTCPEFKDKKATCTYPNGDTAQCTDILSVADKAAGLDEHMRCTNPDKSVGECSSRTFVAPFAEPKTTAQCIVTAADGSAGGTVTTTTDLGGDRATTTIDSAGDSTREETEADVGAGCGANAICWLGLLPGYLASGIAYLLLVLSSLILWVAGSVFNWVVIRTVFQFATYFGTSDGLLVAWGVLRDIANIGLLFGFIFMGIATILNTPNMEGYSAKKALPRLIIFAVLLNFSLFATQGIIDVANGFASVFSSYAGERCDSNTSNTSNESAEKCANVGISGKIAAAAGMNKLPTVGEAWDGTTGMLQRPYTTATMLIILSLLVTITAVVLFAAAIMLVIRVVVLSLLMVTSPIGFAGMAIPALQGIAKDWWHQLLNQSFFAPLYLLMVFISLKLADGLQTGGASVADAITGRTADGATAGGNMQVMVVYAVVIGFMVASLMIAKKMGAAGAGFATNAASAVVYGSLARGMNFATGGAAYLARKGIQNSALGNTSAGRAIVNRGLRPLQNLNMDVRRVAGMGAVLGAAGVTAGAKPAEHATFMEMRHQALDITSRRGSEKLTDQYEQERRRDRLEAIHGDDPSAVGNDERAELRGMSGEELENLHGIREGVAALAQNLTPSQFAALMASKNLTDTDKTRIRNARFGAPTPTGNPDSQSVSDQLARATAGSARDIAAIRNLSTGELEQLARSGASGVLSSAEFARLMSAEQFSAYMKSENIGEGQRNNTRDARYASLANDVNAASNPNDPNNAAALARMRALSQTDLEQIAASSSSALLSNPQFAGLLTADQFSAFVKNERVAENQRNEVRDQRLGVIAGLASRAGTDPAAKAALRNFGVADFDQLEASGSSAVFGDADFASQISDDQAEAILKSPNISANAKDTFKQARKDRFSRTNVQATVQGMSRDKINKLEPEVITESQVLEQLPADQLQSMLKEGKYNQAQRTAIETELGRKFDATRAAATLSTMTAEQIGSLDGNILARPHVYTQLDIKDFEKIQKAGNLTTPQRAAIAQYINQKANSASDPEAAHYRAYLQSDPRVAAYWPT